MLEMFFKNEETQVPTAFGAWWQLLQATLICIGMRAPKNKRHGESRPV